MAIPPVEWPAIMSVRDDYRGYQYFCDVRHPLAHKNGRVWYHRHVASVKINRWLERGEHVHHIDSNTRNNSPENLVVLSNLEHQKIHKGELGVRACEACGTTFEPDNQRSKFCSVKCMGAGSRRFNISSAELAALVWEIPSAQIAKRHGVDGTAVVKRCKLLGIKKPPRGYWQRLGDDGQLRPVQPGPTPRPPWAHGTNNGYTNHRCRCGPCREAHAKVNRRNTQR